MANARTIILVSPDLHTVRSHGDDALWLDRGQVRAVGNAREVVERYMDIERERAAGPAARQVRPFVPVKKHRPPAQYEATVDDPELRKAVMASCRVERPDEFWAEATQPTPYDVVDGEVPVVQGTGEIWVMEVQVLDGRGQPRERFQTGEDLVVAVTFRTSEPVERPIFGVAIFVRMAASVRPQHLIRPGVGWDLPWYLYPFHSMEKAALIDRTLLFGVAVFDKGISNHTFGTTNFDFEVSSDLEDHGAVLMDHAWGLVTHLEG